MTRSAHNRSVRNAVRVADQFHFYPRVMARLNRARREDGPFHAINARSFATHYDPSGELAETLAVGGEVNWPLLAERMNVMTRESMR